MLHGRALAQAAAQSAIVQEVGAIKTIQNASIQLTADSGDEVSIEVSPNARLLRVPPGEKDLKNAFPSQLADLKVGDRILARGHVADQSGKMLASSIVVMKLEDVKTLQQKGQADWQKRGTGGVVKSVNAGAGTIDISGATPGSELSVKVSGKTVFRRYAPDSWKYDDARPGTVQDIQTGDQLRSRGDRSSDGKEIAAEEIVSGTFHNLSGTLSAIDPAAGTVTLKDLQTRKTFVVKTTADSRLLQVPAAMAERIAMRLKGGAAPGTPPDGGNSMSRPVSAEKNPAPAQDSQHPQGQPAPGSATQGRSLDIQQMLSRLPLIQLTDLHSGDAVIVLTTEGSSDHVTAVTLLSGVDSILRGSPNSSQAMNLGSWSLGSSGAEGSAP
jgi:hypothetical protein